MGTPGREADACRKWAVLVRRGIQRTGCPPTRGLESREDTKPSPSGVDVRGWWVCECNGTLSALWGHPGSVFLNRQRAPAASWGLCSPCTATELQLPTQPPPAPTLSSPTLSLQRRNNLEKPWQPHSSTGGGCCSVGGRQWCPWDAAPTSMCIGMCTAASMGDSSFWFGRAVAAGVSWGAPCAHKASMAPAATPPPHWGCPRSLMCLVCFAVLGWSCHRPLGHLSPPTPSLLLLDQVGPWATVPCLPAPTTPQEWASQGHCRYCCGVGCCLARSSPPPPYCNTAEPMLGHLSGGKPCPPSSAGRHWDPHLLSHGILLFPALHMDRHPKPIGVTSVLAICTPQLWVR